MDLYSSSEITVHQLNELKQDDKKIQIIDVREDTERDHAHIKGKKKTGKNSLTLVKEELDKKKNKNQFNEELRNLVEKRIKMTRKKLDEQELRKLVKKRIHITRSIINLNNTTQ